MLLRILIPPIFPRFCSKEDIIGKNDWLLLDVSYSIRPWYLTRNPKNNSVLSIQAPKLSKPITEFRAVSWECVLELTPGKWQNSHALGQQQLGCVSETILWLERMTSNTCFEIFPSQNDFCCVSWKPGGWAEHSSCTGANARLPKEDSAGCLTAGSLPLPPSSMWWGGSSSFHPDACLCHFHPLIC